MKLQYEKLKECGFDQKFDYFHFFKNTLKAGSIEKKTLNSLLYDYPINDYKNEEFLSLRIERVIDEIYSGLNNN
jgi:hypothetical protein